MNSKDMHPKNERLPRPFAANTSSLCNRQPNINTLCESRLKKREKAWGLRVRIRQLGRFW